MFNIMIAVLMTAFWVSLTGPFVLFGMRLYYVIARNVRGKIMHQILWIPCSIGFFMNVPSEEKYRKIYKIVSLIAFILICLGSLFVFYMSITTA